MGREGDIKVFDHSNQLTRYSKERKGGGLCQQIPLFFRGSGTWTDGNEMSRE